MEIGAETALFPGKVYINGIAIAVHWLGSHRNPTQRPNLGRNWGCQIFMYET